MQNRHYAVTVYRPRLFFSLMFDRLPQQPPMSFFMAIIFLLIGAFVANAFYLKKSAAIPSVSAAVANVPAATPKVSAVTPNPKVSATVPKGSEAGLDLAGMSLLPSHSIEEMASSANSAGAVEKNRFALAAGMYIFNKNFTEQQKLAGKVGAPFHVEIKNRNIAMTRLYVGTFPMQKGLALYQKMKKKFPGTFLIKDSKKQTVSVFGGSFYFAEEARKGKDLLVKGGYKVKEVSSTVSLPLYAGYIGNFDSTKDAETFRHESIQSSATEMPVVAVR
jgi:hypothetical protein